MHTIFLYALTFVNSIIICNGAFFLYAHFNSVVQKENTSIPLWNRGNTCLCKVIRTRYYWAQFRPILNPTFCTISLKLLRYSLKQIINQNLYIYVYTTLSCYEYLFIPGNKRTLHYVGLLFHTGYLRHSDRAAYSIT
jgi:hypothetical protein